MKFVNVFDGVRLSDGQLELTACLEEFLMDESSRCFLMKGYAGTGKTFMLTGLVKWLKALGRDCRVLAPTGRAAKVAANRLKVLDRGAATVHASIYSSTNVKEYKVEDEDGTETFKFFFELTKNDDTSDMVYIVDEASMVSNVYSEGEFFRFGSGFLLDDLIEHIQLKSGAMRRKLIFVGDNAQLPPVGMNFSPALNAGYLKERFGFSSSEYELTEVVRQNKDSMVLSNASRLRRSLHDRNYNQLKLEENEEVCSLRNNELTQCYLKLTGGKVTDDVLMVAYSNSKIKAYNEIARGLLFPNEPFLVQGDRLLIVANNYNAASFPIMNGDFARVEWVDEKVVSRHITLKKKDKAKGVHERVVELRFRRAKLFFEDENACCDWMILENLLYSDQANLSSDEMKALYIDLKIRNPHVKPNSDEMRKILREDPFFNALRVKFGYAVTCHKSQGGEWKHVLLDCGVSTGLRNENYFRWLYTGITRAKQNLFLLNKKEFSVGSDIALLPTDLTGIEQRVYKLDEDWADFVIPQDWAIVGEVQRLICLAVCDLIKNSDLVVKRIQHFKYQEVYTFAEGGVEVLVKLYYNGAGMVTSSEVANTNTIPGQWLAKAFDELIKREIVLCREKETEENTACLFEFEDKNLEAFYRELTKKLEGSGIAVQDIEHKSFHEIYTFESGGFKACYKFWYNGKGRFTKTEVITNRTTGLVDEINECLTVNVLV